MGEGREVREGEVDGIGTGRPMGAEGGRTGAPGRDRGHEDHEEVGGERPRVREGEEVRRGRRVERGVVSGLSGEVFGKKRGWRVREGVIRAQGGRGWQEGCVRCCCCCRCLG